MSSRAARLELPLVAVPAIAVVFFAAFFAITEYCRRRIERAHGDASLRYAGVSHRGTRNTAINKNHLKQQGT